MKSFLLLIIIVSAAVFVGQAQATTRYCAAGDRACQRTMLIRGCAPRNAQLTVWQCPDPAPRIMSNEGSGGGGYLQLPTCGPSYYGVILYVQGFMWKCVHATPDHWIIV